VYGYLLNNKNFMNEVKTKEKALSKRKEKERKKE